MTSAERLEAMRLRAQSIVDLGFALANATTLAEAYEAMHYLEQTVERDGDFLVQAPLEELGYVGDKRTFQSVDYVLQRGMDERNAYIKGRMLNAISVEMDGQ